MRPPTALVDAPIQVGRPERVAPVVELLAPELLHLGVELVDPLLALAGIAAEDHLVEDVLGDEARAVAPASMP